MPEENLPARATACSPPQHFGYLQADFIDFHPIFLGAALADF